MKVVFHVDEENKWSEAGKNIHNLRAAAENIKIILLVNGAAIKGYLDPANAVLLGEDQVEFHACHNAMQAFGISPEDLPANVEIVPAGVLDLVKLQHRGYAYIKP
ncbi:DsrE family protein [Candidatus Enterococcus leclercqii]|uniref:DsrE family protein n=1 Tax=Candidatus Enterococcus leclercqii TaxID=1857218 RepID=UPI00137A3222|nr:DsrE family protein [Enterococcus sp. CU9D]KAF1293408.1 sulfur reduction protein DsrE [Enterococcus sp. CU9D]